MSECRLILGDCLDVLRGLSDGSVDAVVTDPPAGIGFMGKEWDQFSKSRLSDEARARQAEKFRPGLFPASAQYSGSTAGQRQAFVGFLSEVLAECFRVARPGARMLCWAIPRTSHWTGTAIEDAGWLIEDRISHLFGQGFPKAKSKLKPACEDWWLARKPGGKVPALNIDACRVAGVPPSVPQPSFGSPTGQVYGMKAGEGRNGEMSHAAGRWPSNVVLSHAEGCRPAGTRGVKTGVHVGRNRKGVEKFSGIYSGGMPDDGTDRGYADPDGLETVESWICVEGCPVKALDEMSGTLKSGGTPPRRPPTSAKTKNAYGDFLGEENPDGIGSSAGGASRFFATFGYFPKASRRDRGDGNTHPTVKSTALMSWLCRLICPPGGTVLDPFAGCGTTGVAAAQLGLSFIGVEKSPEYHAIAQRRLDAARAEFPLLAGT